MTRSRDVADTQDNLGGAVAPFVAGKNKLINGAFQVWQRGTSFTTDSYTADRFYWAKPGTGVGSLTQQTFTPGTAPVAGYEGQFFARSAITSVGSSSYIQFQNVIEDVRTLAGQTVTVSFWAKVNSGSVGGTYARFIQAYGIGGSTNFTTDAMPFTPTGSWQRFSLTQTLPSVSGKTITSTSSLILDVVVPFSANHTIDFWGFQVEAGPVATPFTPAGGGFFGAELALCQRYYQVIGGVAVSYPLMGGYSVSGSEIRFPTPFPVQMRTAPTITKNGTWEAVNTGQPSAVYISSQGFCYQTVTTGTGTFYIHPNSNDDSFTISAEL